MSAKTETVMFFVALTLLISSAVLGALWAVNMKAEIRAQSISATATALAAPFFIAPCATK